MDRIELLFIPNKHQHFILKMKMWLHYLLGSIIDIVTLPLQTVLKTDQIQHLKNCMFVLTA